MENLLSKFLSKSKKNRDLYIKGVLGNDLTARNLFRQSFEDFIFELYFLSYVKKSITYKSLEFKKRKNSLSDNEMLTLNATIVNSDEERINTIPDKPVDFTDLITMDSRDFNEVVSDEHLIKILNKLTIRQQQVIKMLFVDDKDEVQAAQELGISQQSINKVKNKALEKIKKEIGG